MPSVSQSIMRNSDATYIRNLIEIARSEAGQRLGLNAIQLVFPRHIGEPITVKIENIETDPAMSMMLASNTRACSRIVLDGNAQVSVSRRINFESGESLSPFDTVQYQLRDELKDLTDAFRMVFLRGESLFHGAFEDLAKAVSESNNLHFVARDEALARLENLHAKLLGELSQAQLKMQQDLASARKELDIEYQKKEEKHNAEYAQLLANLEAREKTLAEERKKIDDRRSTIVRRELRKELKEVLATRSNKFALSSSTRNRRWFVFGGYFLLLTFFVAVVFLPADQFPLASQLTEPIKLYAILARQILGSLGFIFTMGFLLRWMNEWAQRHTDEELRMLQLDQDIDRASWVAEMTFEWNEEKNSTIPDGLLEILTTNLFGAKAGHAGNPSMTPSDALVKALSNLPGGMAEIQFPGGKMVLNPKALKAAAKSSDD